MITKTTDTEHRSPMKPVIKKLIRYFVVIVAVVAGIVLFGIVPFNAGFLRAPIEDAVRDASGLDLTIGGPIKLRLGLTPTFTSGDLELGDTKSNPLLIVNSLSASIGLFPLLGGRIHLRDVSADGVNIDYCSPLPAPSGNPDEDNAPPSVVIDAINVENIKIHCGSPEQTDQLKIEIQSMFGSAPEGGPMQLRADGSVLRIDFKLLGRGGELNALLAGDDSFPLNLSLESANEVVNVSGYLHAPLENPAVDVEFDVQAADLQSLLAAFGISLPNLGSLRAEGVIRVDSENIKLTGLSGELGESRVELNTTVDLSGERAHLEITAMFEQLDLRPFLNSEQAPRGPDPVAATSDVDLRPVLDVLDTFDADLQLSIERVLGVPVNISDIEVTAGLVEGMVQVQTMAAATLGGHVSMDGSFDSQSGCPELQLHARGSELDLATLNHVLT